MDETTGAKRVQLVGWSSIGAGLFLLALGIWFITTLNGPSFDINTFAGDKPTARDLVLFVVEIALVVAGGYTVAAGIVTLRRKRTQTTFSRSMHFLEPEYATTPLAAVAGRCWQCDSKVRAGSPICYLCGASQHRGRRGGTPGETALEQGWDLGAADPVPTDTSEWSAVRFGTEYHLEAPDSWEGPSQPPQSPPESGYPPYSPHHR